jgi:hypothetical protein
MSEAEDKRLQSLGLVSSLFVPMISFHEKRSRRQHQKRQETVPVTRQKIHFRDLPLHYQVCGKLISVV